MSRTLAHLPSFANDKDRSYRPLGLFVIGILVVGSLRFGLSVSGVSDSLARYASMTGVIIVATVYFGTKKHPTMERLAIAYLLIVPYMLIESFGLGFTLWTSQPTIFHATAYSLGTSLRMHFWGHIIGGLTWEPFILFVMISSLGWVFSRLGVQR